MNKTKIEWCDATWNPVTGCLHNCEYCYARRIAGRFGTLFKGQQPEDEGLSFLPDEPERFWELDEPVRNEGGKIEPFPANFYPTLHRYRMDEPQNTKKHQSVFVCSMAGLFGAWVPDEWIEAVFAACDRAPQHTYLFLTKNAERYEALRCKHKLPARENFWYGSTITDASTSCYWSSGEFNTFLSVEPLLKPPGERGIDKEIRWVIVGAMTGPGSQNHRPPREWVENIMEAAALTKAAVFMKDSLKNVWGHDLIREFPTEMSRESEVEDHDRA